MKKRMQMLLTGAVTAAMLLALAGCGGAASDQAASEAPAGEGTLETYESGEGWAVRYDPALVEVQYGGGAVDFLYTGGPEDSVNADLVTISVEEDKQPEEVLYEITSNWEDFDSIVRSEGFFPGADGKWGFWRNLAAPEDGSSPGRTAIAGEYNGGVLLIQYAAWQTGDEETDMKASGAMETIVDSLTYKDFQPQTMYDYVPGTYSAEQDGAVNSITLNEDHTGVLSMQDDIDILWSSIELVAEDGSFRYEYTIEGDSLLVNYDGQWMTFNK